jgi:hypothetical protein
METTAIYLDVSGEEERELAKRLWRKTLIDVAFQGFTFVTSTMKTPPKAFISHSSEDKERFVNEFALRLRSRGIDAWLVLLC